MILDDTISTWNRALSRSPRLNDYGIFVYVDNLDAVNFLHNIPETFIPLNDRFITGFFLWFSSQEKMNNFLSFDFPMALKIRVKLMDRAVDRICSHIEANPDDLHGLKDLANRIMINKMHVEWIGSYRNLFLENNYSAASVRSLYGSTNCKKGKPSIYSK